jgi:hypothetical protein
MLKLLNRLISSIAKVSLGKRNFVNSRKVTGGGGHGQGHGHHQQKPLEPYEAPHHQTYPDHAYPFGINPAEKYKFEGWEIITAITYIGMFGILFSVDTENHFKVKFLIYNLIFTVIFYYLTIEMALS